MNSNDSTVDAAEMNYGDVPYRALVNCSAPEWILSELLWKEVNEKRLKWFFKKRKGNETTKCFLIEIILRLQSSLIFFNYKGGEGGALDNT